MRVFGGRRGSQAAIERDLVDVRRALAGAEAERQRLRTALDALDVGVVLADGSGTVQVRNAAVSRLDGHEQVLVTEALEALLARAGAGEPCTTNLQFFGPPLRVLSIRAVPIAEGHSLATIDDVSERARLDAVRTDFVANISHELKTPVGAIAVLAEALGDNDDADVTQRLVTRMIDEAHRAARTIDDLMELSRIELGGVAVQEVVDVHNVLTEAIDRARTMADRRSIELMLGAPDFHGKALGDSRQLVSAVANLIDNAVKYSDDGSVVTISAAGVDAWVDVTVADHGIGIPARDLDRIFERFYRVDHGRSRATGGTGLGLAIVRHVATNHGGDVLVRSQEGEGSVFTLRLPAERQI